MVLISNHLDKTWDKFHKLRVWKKYKKLDRGKALIEKFNQALEGLQTIGFDSDALLQIFKYDFAFITDNYDASHLKFAILISSANQKGFFEELLQRLYIFTTINDISPVKEKYLGFTINSLSTNFVYCYINKFMILGNSVDTIHNILDVLNKEKPSLLENEKFSVLKDNLYNYSDFLLYVQQINQLEEFKKLGDFSGLFSGRLTSKLDLKLTLYTQKDDLPVSLIKNTKIPSSFYSFIPKNIYYAVAVNKSIGLMPYFSFKSNTLYEKEKKRNQIFYNRFVSFFSNNLKENNLFICKPFLGSTNFAFVFDAKKIDKTFYMQLGPDKKWLKTYRNKIVIHYYKEEKNDSVDRINYFAKVKGTIIAADSLKMLFAILDASVGRGNIKSSESFKQAFSMTPNNNQIWFIFNTMKWANIAYNDTNYDYLKAFKKFSSFILLTTLNLRNKQKSGISILLKSFPIVK